MASRTDACAPAPAAQPHDPIRMTIPRITRCVVAALLTFAIGSACAATCGEPAPSIRCPDTSGLPHDIVAQLPAGYEALDATSGRLTDGTRIGYVVVAHRPDDSMRNPSPRPLMIFLPDKDGHYRLAARNDAVIMQADEDGMGDPYLDGVAENALTVEPRTFTVEQGVFMGPSHWRDRVTFRYDAAHRTWVFHREVTRSWRLNDDPNGDALKADPVRVTRANAAKAVTFEAWRPDSWCDSAERRGADPACGKPH
ncbi:lipoprotein [Burkholderia metallica]|nr:lipoprotein [Burkholderia metallica]